jgi:phage FluMu gp28-like protein
LRSEVEFSLSILRELKQAHNAKARHDDPVEWLDAETGFKAWPYEAEILSDHTLRLRVVRKSRQIGITTTIAHEAIWKAYTIPERLVLLVSPSDRQSKIVMTRIQAVVNSNPRLHERVTRKNTSELWLDNKSAILSLPNNPDRLRGFSATDIYLDEAAHFLNDEPVMAAIKPMLIATKGRFTVISTPFGKRGLFWDQYRLATDQKGLEPDVKAYDLYPSTISPLISEEDMERERLNLTEMEFRQEYLGEFIEEVDVYYPLDLIKPCVDPTLKLLERGDPAKTYIMGVDFAKQRDETVVIILGREAKNRTLVIQHLAAWSHMDYSDQIGRIGELNKRFKIGSCAADQTGVGEAVIEDLKRVVPNAKGIVFSVTSKTEMAAGLRTLFEQRRIRLPNEKKLIMQINALRYQVSKAGNLLFESSEKEGVHDDYLWALALACNAARETPLVVKDLFDED